MCVDQPAQNQSKDTKLRKPNLVHANHKVYEQIFITKQTGNHN